MLLLALFTSVGAIYAISNNTANTLIFDVDSIDNSISVCSDEKAIDIDKGNCALNTQEKDVEINGYLNDELLANELTFDDIQNKIDNASENDIIELEGTYQGNGKEIVVNKSIIIDGKSKTILNASGLSSIIKINASNVILMNLKLIKSNGDNGAVTSYKNCSILNCVFQDNVARLNGGAISLYYENSEQNTNIVNCDFINNQANAGGAMFLQYEGESLNHLYLTNCNFKKNTAIENWHGNHICIENSNYHLKCNFNCVFNISNCDFQDSVKRRADGGHPGNISISANRYVKAFLDKSSFTNFSTNLMGEYCFDNVTLNQCVINPTGVSGIEISNSKIINSVISTFNVTNCDFYDSFFEGAGNSGIFNSNFDNTHIQVHYIYDWIIINNCNFTNYHSYFEYSMIYITSMNSQNYEIEISNCNFINDYSYIYGGAITIHSKTASLHIYNCSFINNYANISAGAAVIYAHNGEISNCIFDHNYILEPFLSPERTSTTISSNIKFNNNFWGMNILSADSFKTKNLASEKVAITETRAVYYPTSWINLKLEKTGTNTYSLKFVSDEGKFIKEMPDYAIELKLGSITKNLIIRNGETSFSYSGSINDITVLNNAKDIIFSVLTIKPAKLITSYASGDKFNIKVTSSQDLNGVKLDLKVYTGKTFKTYHATVNSKGKAEFKASELAVGYHNVEIIPHDTKFYGFAKSTIKITKAKTIVSAPKIVAKYKKSKKFKITVKNKVSKKVVSGIKIKVKIYTGKKSKTYNLKTNKKGSVIINTNNLKRGEHKVTIQSIDNKYIISAKSTIKIK